MMASPPYHHFREPSAGGTGCSGGPPENVGTTDRIVYLPGEWKWPISLKELQDCQQSYVLLQEDALILCCAECQCIPSPSWVSLQFYCLSTCHSNCNCTKATGRVGSDHSIPCSYTAAPCSLICHSCQQPEHIAQYWNAPARFRSPRSSGSPHTQARLPLSENSP